MGRRRLSRAASVGATSVRAALVGAAVIALVAGCTSSAPGLALPKRPGTSGGTHASGSAAPGAACSSGRAEPDPHRPTMRLAYVLAADHHTVQGTETVVLRPDRPVSEMVFRLTANTKSTVAAGNHVTVTSARVSDTPGTFRTAFTVTPANADPSTQGGLLHLPLGGTSPAGAPVTAEIGFTLTLGDAAAQQQFDRIGRARAFAYLGSGEPLLAWERGFGWHTEDLINFLGESATSEAMDVDLRVTAPAGDTVIASGNPADPPAARAGGVRVWTSHLDAARDVSVAAGPFSVSDTTVDGVALRIGGYDAAIRDALVPEFRRAITLLVARYGPFPFPSLAVARVPVEGGGIEYPGAILMLDSSQTVAVHETAHQYFYAMLGDSQALHPWLDEAFAQYSEEEIDGSASTHDSDLTEDPHPVDSSIASFGQDGDTYTRTIYGKGSAALEAARRAAGPANWDDALCRYVARNAWRIVHPDDLETAIAALPAAVTVLRRAGAIR